MKTGIGQNYVQLWHLHERLAANAELAAQLGIDFAPPQAPGDAIVIEYVRDRVGKPPGMPVLILVGEGSLLRELSPLPGNAHMLSTLSFLDVWPKLRNS